MNDIQIRCFIEAAELENFTKAAEKLYMAQPALSRNIAALEQEIGVQLFTRERKSVRLSEAGRICFQGFKKMMDDYRVIHSQALAAQRKITGGLLIGTAEGQLVGEAYSPTFNLMLNNYPNINFRLSFYSLSELKSNLVNGGVDIALIAKTEVEDSAGDIDFKEVRRCESRLVVPANHPLVGRSDLSLADFKDELFLMLDVRESRTVLNYNEKLQKYGGEFKCKFAPDIGTLALWLESGMGVSILNSWHTLKNSPRLCFLKVPDMSSSVTEVAAWRKNNTNPAVPIFLHALDIVKPEQ